jgi:hypothetical protein
MYISHDISRQIFRKVPTKHKKLLFLATNNEEANSGGPCLSWALERSSPSNNMLWLEADHGEGQVRIESELFVFFLLIM